MLTEEVFSNLEQKLQPKGLALVEVISTENASLCADSPVTVTTSVTKYLGVVRGARPLVERYENGINFFDKYVAYTNARRSSKEWIKLDDGFRLSTDYLPLVNVWSGMSKDERKFERQGQSLKVWKKFPPFPYVSHKSGYDFIPEVLFVNVNTDENGIVEDLIGSPFSSVVAFDLLGLSLPSPIVNEARKQSVISVIDLYREVQTIQQQEKRLEKKLETLHRAASTSGVYAEGGALSIAEDEDDIHVATMGDRLGLNDSYSDLKRHIDSVRQKNVTRFVNEVEVYFGVRINVKEFLDGLEKDFHLDKQN